MIQTIHLRRVLHDTSQRPSRHLVTRPTGRAVRSDIERTLAESQCAMVVLDFAEVELLDLSCAEEIVAKLLLTPGISYCIILMGLREDQMEAVDHVLRHHHLSAAFVGAGADAPGLVGWVEDDLRTAFGAVCAAGPLTCDSFATRVGWSTDRATQALESLAERRLARVDGDTFHSLTVR